MMVETYTFDGAKPGSRLAVLGAIHGNEICGPEGIQRIIGRLESGDLELSKGSVTFVPIANPEAYALRKRMLGQNLNRILRHYENPETYEEQLANELCDLIDNCDVLLDLHSSGAPGPVNLFIDYPTPENSAFARALDAEVEILDWPSTYKGHPELNAYTSDRYAHDTRKVGILIECGQHDDPAAGDVAEESVLRALSYLDMLVKPYDLSPRRGPVRRVRMTQLFMFEHIGDRFAKDWKHLEEVPPGTLVATRASGEEIRPSESSIIFFPKAASAPGDEWFYLGVKAG